jgi:kynurenine formamidase
MKYRKVLAILFSISSFSAFALDIDDYRLVDLSHSYGDSTLYWPTSPSAFDKEELAYGMTEGGWFYSSYSVCTPEHGGTHLDAPIHFAEGGDSTEEIPLENLLAQAYVIDVSEKAAADRNYRMTPDDVREFEAKHGEIEAGTVVLMRTDWSRHWPDAMAYLGDDTPGDASNLQFPGFGAEATRILAEQRKVALLGVDTASVDYGKSQDFIVHRIGAAQGVANLENLTNLNQLPATGAIILALPMKIEGGSGGPARVAALIPK